MKIPRQLRAILSLPFVVVVIIPSLLLLITASIDTRWDTSVPAYGFVFFRRLGFDADGDDSARHHHPLVLYGR